MFPINATGARVSGQCYPKVLYCVRINNFAFSTCLTGAKDSEQRYPRVLCCLQFDIFAFSTCLTGARHSGQCYPESRWRPGGGGLSPASSRSAPGVFRDCSGTVPAWRHPSSSLPFPCAGGIFQNPSVCDVTTSQGFAQAHLCSLVLATIFSIVMFAVSRQSEGFAEAPFCSLELAAFSRIVMFAIERQSG